MQQRLAGQSVVDLVVVGFSPAPALATLAEHLGLDGPVFSDPGREVYRLMGLRRAPLWRVYSPGTLARYARARLRGVAISRPVEDTRQLGGDALVVGGAIVRRWRPSTPDDRVAPAVLVQAALDPRLAR